MMKLNKLIVLMILLTMCIFIKAQVSDIMNYPVELMKHYITSQKYDLALETAEKYLPENVNADSLYWLSALIHQDRQEYLTAVEQYAKVIEISQDSLLVSNSSENLIKLISHVESRTGVNILVKAVKEVHDDDNYQKLIMKLANLYENNYLYSEANDIYTILLESDFEVDKRDLYIKIATNKVFEKKYQEAVVYADKADAAVDSVLSGEALFIEFLSYQALGENAKALVPLVKLYMNFPEFAKLFEINLNLADLLLEANDKLAAWYVLEKYYPIASKLEKELIEDKLKEIVHTLSIEPGQMNYFDNFILNFDSYLKEN